jgi:FkbM family methyltransferase
MPFVKGAEAFGLAWRRVTKLVSMLGPVQAAYFLVHWVLGSQRITLRLPGIATPLICRPRDSDLSVLWTAFFLRDCDFEFPFPPSAIIDAGANVGYVSVFLANKYPEARILAVEVDPGNVEILRENVQNYNVDVVQAALWSSHSCYCVDRSSDKSYGFRVREVAEETPGALRTLTITDLLEKLGTEQVDLLKLDIEGGEEALFAANYDEWLHRIGALIVEVHGAKAEEAIRGVMTNRGFAMQQQGEKLVYSRLIPPNKDLLQQTAKISIVVPCYNCAAFLAATVESVLAQDLDDWELTLVDDGSTDGTPEIIRRYCSKDCRIKGVWQANGGRARACNFGVTHISSESKYIFFLDSDDLLVPKALQVLSSYLDTHPDVGLLTCQMQEIDTKATHGSSARRSRWVPGKFFPRPLSEDERETPFITFFCQTGQGPFALFRKSVFLHTTGFEESLSRFSAHEDSDIFCQMALAGTVHHLAERLYLKRKHGAQITADHARIQQGSLVFRDKWDRFQSRNIQEEKVLRDAKKYYYGTHVPLRNLKVAGKAFSEFLSTGKQSSLRWGLRLLGDAVSGFCGRYQHR